MNELRKRDHNDTIATAPPAPLHTRPDPKPALQADAAGMLLALARLVEQIGLGVYGNASARAA